MNRIYVTKQDALDIACEQGIEEFIKVNCIDLSKPLTTHELLKYVVHDDYAYILEIVLTKIPFDLNVYFACWCASRIIKYANRPIQKVCIDFLNLIKSTHQNPTNQNLAQLSFAATKLLRIEHYVTDPLYQASKLITRNKAHSANYATKTAKYVLDSLEINTNKRIRKNINNVVAAERECQIKYLSKLINEYEKTLT